MDKHSESKKSSDKKSKSSKPKKEIVVLNKGPVFICELCHALLKVPEKLMTDEEVEVEEEDKKYLVIEVSFVCPNCNERNVVEEYDPSDDEEPVKKSKGK